MKVYKTKAEAEENSLLQNMNTYGTSNELTRLFNSTNI